MTHLLVAGGGPVGLAAAIEARLRGLDVTVVEPRTCPVDKACGEGLMPGAVARLQRLGVHPPGHPFDGISYLAASGRRGGRHAFRSGKGRGVRRIALHAAMARRAAELGVHTVQDTVVAVSQDAAGVRLRLAGGSVDGAWALGCDGLRSVTRSLVAVRATTNGRRYGLRRHVQLQPWSRDVEVHWSHVGEAYVTPVAADQVGIAILSASGLPFDTSLQHFPALRARLDGAEWVSELRGAGPLRQNVSRRVAGRVLLVGDAAGYVDALTGEGLRLGFECASAALDAVQSDDAERYERRWRELTRGYRLLTAGLVSATRVRAVRAAIVPASGWLPGVFGRAVESLAG